MNEQQSVYWPEIMTDEEMVHVAAQMGVSLEEAHAKLEDVLWRVEYPKGIRTYYAEVDGWTLEAWKEANHPGCFVLVKKASMSTEPTIWEKQEELRQWHEREYKQEYPNSEFNTGRTLAATSGTDYDALPDEVKERKERAAYAMNKMLFGLGVNVSGNFREE